MCVVWLFSIGMLLTKKPYFMYLIIFSTQAFKGLRTKSRLGQGINYIGTRSHRVNFTLGTYG